TNVFEAVFADDKTPCVPPVVTVRTRYCVVPPVSAAVSSYVVVVEIDRSAKAMVATAFQSAPALWVSSTTTLPSVKGVGRTGNVKRIVPDVIDVATKDAGAAGVVRIVFDATES